MKVNVMNKQEILSILSSLNHNSHYLNRYYKLVEHFSKQEIIEGVYYENHHICPKASDMFPEYSSFRLNPWNKITVTARQHVLLHVLLWKTYPKSSSQITALFFMLDRQNDLKDKTSRRKIPTSISIRYLSKTREEYFKSREGKSTYKNMDGEKFFLSKDDPRIQAEGLVGYNYGIKYSEETIEKLRRGKDPYRKVSLYRLDQKISVSIHEDMQKYFNDGWNTQRTEEDYEYIKKQQYERSSASMAGRARYSYRDGTFYGMITKDDPAIKELDLIIRDTDKSKAQRKRRQELAVEALTGTETYNNGVVEKRFRPGDDTTGWTLGRLPRSEEYQKNFLAGVKKANSDKKYWNNGTECKKLPLGEHPGEGWVEGMLPRPKSNMKHWHNGEISRKFPEGTHHGEGWVPGMLPKNKK